jgi:hypothetical protein
MKTAKYSVKTAKLVYWVLSGFLVMIMAGCVNPMVTNPTEKGAVNDDAFTVVVNIGETGEGRAVAGTGGDAIRYGQVRNFVQLVVKDTSGSIVSFVEKRREGDYDTTAELIIPSINFNKEYTFLILMGHWERYYNKESADVNGKISSYSYIQGTSTYPCYPTLLAMGSKTVTVTKNDSIEIKMYPIVVDTKFFSSVNNSTTTEEPKLNTNGKPAALPLPLLPVPQKVCWSVYQEKAAGTKVDLSDALNSVKTGNGAVFKKLRTALDVENVVKVMTSSDLNNINSISRDISAFSNQGAAGIGKTASVYFNVDYVPFSQNDESFWHDYKDTSIFAKGNAVLPLWIIRNGVNDANQNSQTDFSVVSSGNYDADNNPINTIKWGRNANGNGAVSIVLAESGKDGNGDPTGPVYPGTDFELKITDGQFKGYTDNTTSTIAKISFDTANTWTGDADVYYQVTAKDAAAPGKADYILLKKDGGTNTPMVVGPNQSGFEVKIDVGSRNDCDVYVMLFKDGKISNPLKINLGSGSVEVGVSWD